MSISYNGDKIFHEGIIMNVCGKVSENVRGVGVENGLLNWNVSRERIH